MAVFFAVFEKKNYKNSLFSSKQGKCFGFLCLLVVLSWIIEGQWGVSPSLQMFVSFFIFYYLTVTMINDFKRLRIVLWSVFFTMFISSLYIIKEYLHFSRISSASYRPGGTFGDPNYFSLSAIMALPFAYFLIKKSDNIFIKIIIFLMILVYIIALTICMSRGALIGLLCMVIVTILLSDKKFKVLILMAMLCLCMSFFLPERFIHRISGTKIVTSEEATGDIASTTRRWYLIMAGLKMVRSNPFFGVGLGNFKSESIRYEPVLGRPGVAHNSYVELAAELGLPALILYLGIIYFSFRELLDLKRKNMEYQLLFSCLIISLVGFIISSLFLTGYNTKLFWIIVFLTIALKNNLFDVKPAINYV